jgi:CRISPR/Cas system CSM-associated protein Csm3 (group 7 of RAMP superfamily)
MRDSLVRNLSSTIEFTGFEAKFVGILEFESEGPIHVGGSRWSNILYLLRLPDGRLLIPATTWKGAFRDLAKKLAPSLPLSDVEKLAIERVSLTDNLTIKQERVKDLLNVFEEALRGQSNPLLDPGDVRRVLMRIGYDEGELEEPEDLVGMLIRYLEYYCPVGRLFGNSVHAASVRFFDTLISTSTMRRPSVGIDRGTGTAKKDVLYFVESTPPNVRARLVIIGEIQKRGDSAARLLASLLETVKALGVSVGGRKSAGYGLFLLKNSYFHVIELSKDRDRFGELLANPFKTDALSSEAFISWLRGQS